MLGLAEALASEGCHVTYVAQQPITADRVALGWTAANSNSVEIVHAPTSQAMRRAAMEAGDSSMHISQGLRGNDLISAAQEVLRERKMRQWIVMETVEESDWRSLLKRLEYRRLFLRQRNQIEGVLAVGHNTSEWVFARGVPAGKIFQFAYFLSSSTVSVATTTEHAPPFRFVFVGQFIERKRLSLLIRALSELPVQTFELTVIGSGPLEESLQAEVGTALTGRVRWIGRLPSAQVPQELAQADCLVLPSRHDGWGAVISEAMMVGTPVVCSDSCGAAGTVRSSGSGGVFDRNDSEGLKALLASQLAAGPVAIERRQALAAWAECLGADVGAKYLLAILAHVDGQGPRPSPPWQATGAAACVV